MEIQVYIQSLTNITHQQIIDVGYKMFRNMK